MVGRFPGRQRSDRRAGAGAGQGGTRCDHRRKEMSSRTPSRTRPGQFRLWSLPRTWSRLGLRPRASPPAPHRSRRFEAHYCEYRSQWTFPSSSPTLAIWTNSSSEHPRAHLSHCCFLPKSRAHASAPANTIWPLRAFTPALMPSASLLLGSDVRCRQSSKCLQMFFGLLHTA
jgi:hypothetical protein